MPVEGPIFYRLNDDNTGPDLLLEVFRERGWQPWEEYGGVGLPGASSGSDSDAPSNDHTWHLWWRHGFPANVYRKLRSFQLVSHIPKGNGLCRKDALARSLQSMRRTFGSVYDFFPTTFLLPCEYTKLVAEYTRLLYPTSSHNVCTSSSSSSSTPNNSPRSQAITFPAKISSQASSRCHWKSNDRSGSPLAWRETSKGNELVRKNSSKNILERSLHTGRNNGGPSTGDVITKQPNVWICKPTMSSQGRGITIFEDVHQLTYGDAAVAQQYISNPLLVGGYKCDLRLYILVTSLVPLTVYMYQEGIVRFGTEKYNLSTLDRPCSHLTNTSLNKGSPGYSLEKERVGSGCKWSLRQLRRHLSSTGVSDWLLWQRVSVLVSLTLLAQLSRLQTDAALPHGAQNCFELYGFDILVDDNLTPWLLEVNRCPSISYDCDVDRLVKKPMLHHLFDLLGPPRVTQPIEKLLNAPAKLFKQSNNKKKTSRTSSLDSESSSGDDINQTKELTLGVAIGVEINSLGSKCGELKATPRLSVKKTIPFHSANHCRCVDGNLPAKMESTSKISSADEVCDQENNSVLTFLQKKCDSCQNNCSSAIGGGCHKISSCCHKNLEDRKFDVTTSKSDDELNSSTRTKSVHCRNMNISLSKRVRQGSAKKMKKSVECTDCRNPQIRPEMLVRRNSSGFVNHNTITNRTYRKHLSSGVSMTPGHKNEQNNNCNLLASSGLSVSCYSLRCQTDNNKTATQTSSSTNNKNLGTTTYLPGDTSDKENAMNPSEYVKSGMFNRTEASHPKTYDKFHCNVPKRTMALSKCNSTITNKHVTTTSSNSSVRVSSCFIPGDPKYRSRKHADARVANGPDRGRMVEELAPNTFVPVSFNSSFQRLRQQLLGVNLVPAKGRSSRWYSSISESGGPSSRQADNRGGPSQCGGWVRTFPFNTPTQHATKHPMQIRTAVAEIHKYRRCCEKISNPSEPRLTPSHTAVAGPNQPERSTTYQNPPPPLNSSSHRQAKGIVFMRAPQKEETPHQDKSVKAPKSVSHKWSMAAADAAMARQVQTLLWRDHSVWTPGL